MQAQNTITDTFKCPLEWAFKTPILGDATKILTGYGCVPPLIGFTDDATWGKPGGSRIPIMRGNLLIKGGPQGFDEIVVREEHTYWKWRVSQMDRALFFVTEAIGEWWCTPHQNGTVNVKWRYTWVSTNILTQPITWLFVRIFWRRIMKNGMISIKNMAETETPFLYD